MSNFFCAAPWRGLHINPRGDVKTCCAGDPNMLGNLNSNTITEILDSDLLKQIRSEMSQGRAHKYCSNCVQAERFGADSERKWHNDTNPNFDYATAGDQYHYPVIVDVRWNTTCNLSCNYCSEWASSKWSALKGIPFKSGSRPYYEQVCDFLEQHKSHIQDVALVGGEPLLLPENERLLDVIPEDCAVTLITNMNVDLSKNKIFQKLAQRKRVGWSMSFDNIGAQFEYVRYGGDWNMLTENLATVKDLFAKGQWGGIHAVYNIYNATRITEFREWAASQGVTVLWQNLFQPDYLDPLLHGPAVAQAAADEIERFYATGLATPAERQFFDNALNTYRAVTQPQPGIEARFRRHITEIETQYHKDQNGKFVQLWPELAHLIQKNIGDNNK
jgi:radical SAM protein with 4Fe4S-binding SPASM domain